MAKQGRPKDSDFIAGNPPQGAARPRMNKPASKAPPGNASNSAKPSNPGNLNVLRKLSQDGSFKTGLSK